MHIYTNTHARYKKRSQPAKIKVDVEGPNTI